MRGTKSLHKKSKEIQTGLLQLVIGIQTIE